MEDLDTLKNKIEEYSKEKSMNLIKDVHLQSTRGGVLFFDDFKKLIDFGVSKNIKEFFFQFEIFKEDSFKEAEEILEEEHLKELKEKYVSYFGKVSFVQLYFVSGGFSFLFSDSSDWFEEYNNENKKESEEASQSVKCKDCENIVHNFSTERGEEYCFECLGKKREEGETKIREMSKVLMDDNEFNECKNEMQRKIYLEENYSDLANNRFISLSQLSERTRALIDMKKRKELASKV